MIIGNSTVCGSDGALRWPRGLVSATMLAAAGLGLATAAQAHPHVFVTAQTTVVYENGAITGLKHRWLFDEFYTAGAIEGLDKNKDGKVDRDELAELTRINVEGIKEFDYFTAVKLGAQALAIADPIDAYMEVIETRDAPGPQAMYGIDPQSPTGAPPPKPAGLWARLSDAVAGWWARTIRGEGGEPEKTKVLVMGFTMPLRQPVLAEAQGFNFTVQDPAMFIAFALAAKDPVLLSEGAPKGCTARIGAAELDEEQKKLAEAFGQGGQMMLVGSAKTVTMTCPKP